MSGTRIFNACSMIFVILRACSRPGWAGACLRRSCSSGTRFSAAKAVLYVVGRTLGWVASVAPLYDVVLDLVPALNPPARRAWETLPGGGPPGRHTFAQDIPLLLVAICAWLIGRLRISGQAPTVRLRRLVLLWGLLGVAAVGAIAWPNDGPMVVAAMGHAMGVSVYALLAGALTACGAGRAAKAADATPPPE